MFSMFTLTYLLTYCKESRDVDS